MYGTSTTVRQHTTWYCYYCAIVIFKCFVCFWECDDLGGTNKSEIHWVEEQNDVFSSIVTKAINSMAKNDFKLVWQEPEWNLQRSDQLAYLSFTLLNVPSTPRALQLNSGAFSPIFAFPADILNKYSLGIMK